MTNQTVTVKLDRCGFCGARKNAPCREFGQEVVSHDDRFTTLPDLFIEALDGITAPDVETARRWKREEADALWEIGLETAYERHLETNDQYRWEVEEDERRAAAFGLAFDAWQDSIWAR